jgi:sugar phosphate isomerase/epimerase
LTLARPFIGGNNAPPMLPPPDLYLQLYSLRHETAVDAEGVLRRVSSLGFDGVELVGDYGWSIERWLDLLGHTGLEVLSAMHGLDALETTFAEQVAFHRALGAQRLVVPGLSPDMHNPAGFREAARRFNALGRELAKEGFLFGYHNHAWELEPLDGGSGCGMDILLHETDPALVRFEFDTHWLEFGGHAAAPFLRQHAPRVLQIHAKDFRKADREDVPAGQGDVDFPSIVPLCLTNEWPIVLEYEGGHALEAVRQGAVYLRSLF